MPRRLASWIVIVLATVVTPSSARGDGMMLVAAGVFWMGRGDGPADEAPLHRVFVRDFWIDRHKVTNAEFAAFLNATGLRPPGSERRYDEDDADARIHLSGGRWTPDPGFDDHPVVEVSWFGARDYCRWKGRRLPTEAEWEKAARGDDLRLYPWGTAPPSADTAVFGRPYTATASVAARPRGASPYRAEDKLATLRAWTSTVFRP
jgi:formylglycine-generating enzyme required for sulfatase activity